MPSYKTEIAQFSRLIWHPARKWSGSILTTKTTTRLAAAYCCTSPTKISRHSCSAQNL